MFLLSDIFCPADHVPDWQPRILLGMVEARSVNVNKTNPHIIYTHTHFCKWETRGFPP